MKYLKNALKNYLFLGAGWEDHCKYSIIRAKRGVCKVTGMVFLWNEDANNFKNISDQFGGQNCYFLVKMPNRGANFIPTFKK